jgi:hypothetical protein
LSKSCNAQGYSKIKNNLPNPAVIIDPAEIIDMIRISEVGGVDPRSSPGGLVAGLSGKGVTTYPICGLFGVPGEQQNAPGLILVTIGSGLLGLAGLRNPKDVGATVLEAPHRVFGLGILVDDGLGLTGQYMTLPFNLVKVCGVRMGLTRQGKESQSGGEDKDVPHKGSSSWWVSFPRSL